MAALQIDTSAFWWHAEANCKGRDPAIFFPDRGDSRPATQAAREICGICTVKQECLEYALDSPDGLHGIWGGTSGRERRVLRRERKQQS